MTIQSDYLTASQYATQITSSGSSVSEIGTVGKDNETTLSGNDNAHSAIDLDDATGTQIASVLSTFVSLIHSTASEFEAVDNQISQQLGATTSATTLHSSSKSSTSPTFTPNTSLFGGS